MPKCVLTAEGNTGGSHSPIRQSLATDRPTGLSVGAPHKASARLPPSAAVLGRRARPYGTIPNILF